MMKCLKRYWFEFDLSEGELSSYYACFPTRGCGITAYDFNDALKIMRLFILRDDYFPKFSRIVENIDVSTLEENHILPNAGVPVWRGVWYPSYNLSYGPYIES